MLYSSLRLLHFAAIILWVGGGFSLPVIADIRRTLALGTEHGPALHARLVTTTRLVVPSAVVALLTGVALIQLRGGFSAVPRRFHVALSLALLMFLVGGHRPIQPSQFSAERSQAVTTSSRNVRPAS